MKGYESRNKTIGLETENTLIIQRRLDFWLVDKALQEEIEQVDIVPSSLIIQ